jgi:hypothetical protein
MALTLKQIVNFTAKFGSDRFEKAGTTVRATSLKFGRSKTTDTVRAITKTWSEKGPKGWHKTEYATMIDFIDLKDHVKVTCSCPDYCFMFEVALYRKGAADLIYSNGRMPNEKNSNRVPGMCKHLIRMCDLLVTKGKIDGQFRLK